MNSSRSNGATDVVAALEHASKRFGGRDVVRDLDLTVRRGTFHAVVGANGAGKSTALSMLLGLRRPDAGRATLFGRSPRDSAARVRSGCTPQEISFPERLRPLEILEFVRAHYPNPRSVEQLVEQFALAPFAKRQCGGLSGGQSRLLALAVAFAGNPEIVFVDEPTNGLDLETTRLMWTIFRAYMADGGTMLAITHHLGEIETLADTVTVIDRGRVVATGSVDDVRRRARGLTAPTSPDALPHLEPTPAMSLEDALLILSKKG